MSSRLISRGAVATVATACAALIAGCGSRGPLDYDSPVVMDAGALEPATDAGIDTGADAAPDVRPGEAIVNCGTCVVGQCGAGVLQCLQSPGCQSALQCVVTTCLSSGSPDPSCLASCAAGDTTGALQMFRIFQCITNDCGTDCASVLGGILGGGGGGGRGGRGRGPGAGTEQVPPLAQLLYSKWPELASHK